MFKMQPFSYTPNSRLSSDHCTARRVLLLAGGDGLQVLRLSANILNKQSSTLDVALELNVHRRR